MLTKSMLKRYIDPKSPYTKEQVEELRRYVQARIDYRETDKELKSILKKTISPIISDNYKHLIGVVERELYENFYKTHQVNVKYIKKVPKSNYMDYLSVRELKCLNEIKSILIEQIDSRNIKTINGVCYLAGEVGRAGRIRFLNKYSMRPEDMPAEEVSFAVCKSSLAKLDSVISLKNAPENKPKTIETESGQIKMNYSTLFNNKNDDVRGR